jgi:hypothetical protein
VKEFRVIRVVTTTQDGLFELGVEMIQPTTAFWGIHFPTEAPRMDA